MRIHHAHNNANNFVMWGVYNLGIPRTPKSLGCPSHFNNLGKMKFCILYDGIVWVPFRALWLGFNVFHSAATYWNKWACYEVESKNICEFEKTKFKTSKK